VYHAHLRPLTSLPAAALDLSAWVHRAVPAALPTPAGALRAFAAVTGVDAASSMAGALTIPPIHVEHVAEAIVAALDPTRTDVRGPLGVRDMRTLIGWAEKGLDVAPAKEAEPAHPTMRQ
jgi:hypothetical protein